MEPDGADTKVRKPVEPMRAWLCRKDGDGFVPLKVFDHIPTDKELKDAIKESAGEADHTTFTLLTGRAREVSYTKVVSEKFSI